MKYKIFSSVDMSKLESEINSLARRKEIVSVQFSTSSCMLKTFSEAKMFNCYSALVTYRD